MRKIVIGLGMCLLSTFPALAQQQVYVPPQFTQEQWNALMATLGQMPHDMIEPVVSGLRQIEANAIADKQKADSARAKAVEDQNKAKAEADKPKDESK